MYTQIEISGAQICKYITSISRKQQTIGKAFLIKSSFNSSFPINIVAERFYYSYEVDLEKYFSLISHAQFMKTCSTINGYNQRPFF